MSHISVPVSRFFSSTEMSHSFIPVMKWVVSLLLYWNVLYFCSCIEMHHISVPVLNWVVFLLLYWTESSFCLCKSSDSYSCYFSDMRRPCFRYPEYLFISNKEFSQSAYRQSTRYTESSLRGIILDTHFLSLTNYLVCGFSSNVRVRDCLPTFTLYHIQ